jgi:hypothetical protein
MVGTGVDIIIRSPMFDGVDIAEGKTNPTIRQDKGFVCTIMGHEAGCIFYHTQVMSEMNSRPASIAAKADAPITVVIHHPEVIPFLFFQQDNSICTNAKATMTPMADLIVRKI